MILEICNSGFLDNFGLMGFNYFGTIGRINIEKNDTFHVEYLEEHL